jgi:small subunit ribosomal protein S8
MTDQTADLLVRIKNAAEVRRHELEMPYSKMKEAILKILEANGFVKNIKVSEDKLKKNIFFELVANKYPTHIKQISKPGHRIYSKGKDIKIPLRGLALVIISTSSGVINAKEASKKGLGGELICEIW